MPLNVECVVNCRIDKNKALSHSEGNLAGQARRIATVAAMTDSVIVDWKKSLFPA